MRGDKWITLHAFILLICQLTPIANATEVHDIEDLVVQGKLTISLKVNTLAFNDNTEANLLISFSVSEAKTLINKINTTKYAKVKGG